MGARARLLSRSDCGGLSATQFQMIIELSGPDFSVGRIACAAKSTCEFSSGDALDLTIFWKVLGHVESEATRAL